MPYIKKENRKPYDMVIEYLAEVLNTKSNDEIAGEMNYIIYRLGLLLTIDDGKRNYARMATVSSAIGEAQAEFRRRILAPYEDEKIYVNGDINL